MNINFIDNFEQTVNRVPDNVAVKHRDNELSFRDLRNRARIMGTLLAEKVDYSRNAPVAVFLPKSLSAVVADLGVLYSANPFMNLDIKMPAERIQSILIQVCPIAIITSVEYAKKLPTTDCLLIFIDDVDWTNIQSIDESLNQFRTSLIDTDPFCLINTSGSTGTPKAVILNHRSFFDFISVSNERFCFDGTEVMGSLSPIVFDIFDFELCMMMINGSQIVLLDAMLASFPARLLETLKLYQVSFIFWVPSIMVNIANLQLLDRIPLPDLKMIWFAGEVFPTKQFLVWFDALPHSLFVNLYGPIEITLDCTFYIIDQRPNESDPLPIGIPYKNTDILILNDGNQLCGIGEEGELCVRGTSLAMGYYNNPEKTAMAFTQNPLNTAYPEIIYRTGDIVFRRDDGNIIFKGRKDNLIKHMGYRIELDEIEHVMVNRLKLVKHCCAVYRYASKEIVLYYENDQELTDKAFRTVISTLLPNYMLPSVYIWVDELPRNVNGKIDRLRLKEKANS